ncbi:MAG: TerB family tellurite resistance protein [Archangium sp.]
MLKLLVHVAWVDGGVDQQESQLLLSLGRSWTVPEAALQQLLEDVKEGKKPAEPDYALLKTRADDAVMAARTLVLADGKVKPEESALLKKIVASLA